MGSIAATDFSAVAGLGENAGVVSPPYLASACACAACLALLVQAP